MATVYFENKRPWQQNLPYTGVDPKNPTLNDCSNANGIINNPDDDTGLTPVAPYVPPELCVGEFTISQGDCGITENNYQEELAAEVLNISGAPVNIFKYLGIHEQGKLIDLVGHGKAVGSDPGVANVFNLNLPEWQSEAKGLQVVTQPAFIGYDFGMKATSQGQLTMIPGAPEAKMITSIRIQQPISGNRALQLRIDQSTGDLLVNPNNIRTTGNIGDGELVEIEPGSAATLGEISLFADSPTAFTVIFRSSMGDVKMLGSATVGKRFLSTYACFTIKQGSIPFQDGDNFAIPVELNWRRVDVVNVPNVDAPITIPLRQSSPARYWRIVPVVFQGVTIPDASWIVSTVELFDVAGPSLDDIQDTVFMENRDREYARSCIQIKAQYTPFDAVSDLSKFGFQIADIYTFTTSFAVMVSKLGRPIVIGDVIELPSELQYDHHLRPVRKFLEVTDVGWSADGFTTGWKPIIYKFQAQQLIPGQQHQSLFGNVATQKYGVSDDQMFAGLQQINTTPLTSMEHNAAEALESVSKTGIDHLEFRSGTDWMGTPGTYDGLEYGMQNAIPPDGQEYSIGFKLPPIDTATDRDFFRLEYDPALRLPARLYQFSALKGSWIHIETDQREIVSSHNKNQRRVFNSIKNIPPEATKF